MSTVADSSRPVMTAGDSSKERRRPPALDLKGCEPGAAAGDSSPIPRITTSSSVASSTATTSVPLKTPKELMNDIAVECVSPAIPTHLSSELQQALAQAKSIEIQQRKIIAARVQDETSVSVSSGNIPKPPLLGPPNVHNTTIIEVQQDSLVSPSSPHIPISAGLKPTKRRAPRPDNIKLYPPPTSGSLTPYSAPPEYRRMHHLSTTPNGTAITPAMASAGGAATTASNSADSTTPNRHIIAEQFPTPRSTYRVSPESTSKPTNNSNSNSVAGSVTTPSLTRARSADAALPDQATADPMDQDEKEGPAGASKPLEREGQEDDVERYAIDADDELRAKRAKIDHPTAPTERKQRFIALCSEMWDLFHS